MKLSLFFLFTVYGRLGIELFSIMHGHPPDLTIVLLMNKIQEHKINTVTTKKRIIRAPVINSDTPWAFFDDASQGEPPLGGAGAIIYISSKKKLLIKYALGQSSNNRAELATLRAV